MTESENNAPTTNESPEPSPAPSTPPQPKLDVVSAKRDLSMLEEFREGIKEGIIPGQHVTAVAKGLAFLDALIGQASGQIQFAERQASEGLSVQ